MTSLFAMLATLLSGGFPHTEGRETIRLRRSKKNRASSGPRTRAGKKAKLFKGHRP